MGACGSSPKNDSASDVPGSRGNTAAARAAASSAERCSVVLLASPIQSMQIDAATRARVSSREDAYLPYSLVPDRHSLLVQRALELKKKHQHQTSSSSRTPRVSLTRGSVAPSTDRFGSPPGTCTGLAAPLGSLAEVTALPPKPNSVAAKKQSDKAVQRSLMDAFAEWQDTLTKSSLDESLLGATVHAPPAACALSAATFQAPESKGTLLEEVSDTTPDAVSHLPRHSGSTEATGPPPSDAGRSVSAAPPDAARAVHEAAVLEVHTPGGATITSTLVRDARTKRVSMIVQVRRGEDELTIECDDDTQIAARLTSALTEAMDRARERAAEYVKSGEEQRRSRFAEIEAAAMADLERRLTGPRGGPEDAARLVPSPSRRIAAPVTMAVW